MSTNTTKLLGPTLCAVCAKEITSRQIWAAYHPHCAPIFTHDVPFKTLTEHDVRRIVREELMRKD